MWFFGCKQRIDKRDELIEELLETVNKVLEIGTFLSAENDYLRAHLQEMETDWKNCLDPDREPGT